MLEDSVTAFGLHSVFQQQQTTHQPRAVTTLLMCPISGVRSKIPEIGLVGINVHNALGNLIYGI